MNAHSNQNWLPLRKYKNLPLIYAPCSWILSNRKIRRSTIRNRLFRRVKAISVYMKTGWKGFRTKIWYARIWERKKNRWSCKNARLGHGWFPNLQIQEQFRLKLYHKYNQSNPTNNCKITIYKCLTSLPIIIVSSLCKLQGPTKLTTQSPPNQFVQKEVTSTSNHQQYNQQDRKNSRYSTLTWTCRKTNNNE